MRIIKKFEELDNKVYLSASTKLRNIGHDLRSVKLSSYSVLKNIKTLGVIDNKPILIEYEFIKDLFYICDIDYKDNRIIYIITNKDNSITLKLYITFYSDNNIFFQLYQTYELFDEEEDYLILSDNNKKLLLKNRKDVWRLIKMAKEWLSDNSEAIKLIQNININKLYK